MRCAPVFVVDMYISSLPGVSGQSGSKTGIGLWFGAFPASTGLMEAAMVLYGLLFAVGL